MMPGGLLAAFFGLGWLPLYLFRAETRAEAMPYYTRSERLWVRLAPTAVALHVTAACTILSLGPPIPLWRGLLGLSVHVAGVAFWLWARACIGPLRRTRLPGEPPLCLRRDGPFGVVRNPLYLGVLVLATAPVITIGRPLLLVSLGLGAVCLAIRAAQEERRLHHQLGAEYADYCREVRRLIPFVW